MGKLKVISARELLQILDKLGYSVDHQTGSHKILRNSFYPNRRVTVPNHKEIAKGTLRNIIRECGITIEEFNALLKY